MSKSEKINWILTHHNFSEGSFPESVLRCYWHEEPKVQHLHDTFSENTLSNFWMPFGVAPNFLINGDYYTVPMVTEESSVVAAAGKSAGFWAEKQGFCAKVISTKKLGHVHFYSYESLEDLQLFFKSVKHKFLEDSESITRNMNARGGGIQELYLVDKTTSIENYYQIEASFKTMDAMGANFINTCMECFADTLKREAESYFKSDKPVEVIMSILSNYVPDCVVSAEVSCHLDQLTTSEMKGEVFADRFIRALEIAENSLHRAVTHNKGIMNGVDAVVIATGNDFRAVEACVHAYASHRGRYQSLSKAEIQNDGIFRFWLELPLALGTVGGMTTLHPLSKLALELLGNPSSDMLMRIVASVGLAQNFAAIQSLVTKGIQKGHMKMHLDNILSSLDVSKDEHHLLSGYFNSHAVSHSAVAEQLSKIRKT